MGESRINNSVKNILSGAGGQIINTILSFINRSIFLSILGITYLSINGLFLNIISVLSFAELGVGDAIIFSLYSPLAKNDNRKITKLMNLYRKAYTIIGIFILLTGLCFIPFLKYLIKDNINNLNVIYLLFLLNTVFSYFYTYKKSILIANQKAYICNLYNLAFNVIKIMIQISMLLLTKSFIIYLIIEIIFTLLSNIFISKKVDNLNIYENNKELLLDGEEKKEIFNNIKSLVVYKFSGILLGSTDNIIISKFVGLDWIGYISNYDIVIGAITTILNIVFSSFTASVGNLIASEDKEKNKEIFDSLNMMNFWMYGLATIGIYSLINEFINIWIGNKYLIDKNILLILVFNFYFVGMHQVTWIYRSATGIFRETKYIILITALLNIIISICLSLKLGVFGVFLGTAISRMLTSAWYEPMILFNKYFNSNVTTFYWKNLKYFFILIIGVLINKFFIDFINITGILGLLIKGIVIIIMTNFWFFMVLRKRSEFKYVYFVLVNIFLKLKSKLKLVYNRI
ncbi:sugar translocase [Clostridium perfringens]|nr:sugar translocase [Clostridium perfringens]